MFYLVLAEVVAFFALGSQYGFPLVLLAYWAPCILGFLILSATRKHLQSAVQNPEAFQNQINANFQSGNLSSKSANAFAFLVSGLLFVIPFITTRAMAILMILPPTRKLVFFIGKAWLVKKIANGQFVMFGTNQGFGFRSGFGQDFSGGRPPFSEMKDVTPKPPLEIASDIIDLSKKNT